MEDKCSGLNSTINDLPAPIIETILCLVPLEEAVRTSILSREWRYHWTKIPKLVFIQDALKGYRFDHNRHLSMLAQAKRKLFNNVNQVMSMHQGPVFDFTLITNQNGPCPSLDIDRIIDNFSRNNTIKKLTLDIKGYSLPKYFFSLHKLTDLYLHFCRLDVQPTFNIGLGSLANLCMENVVITKKALLLFLRSCPLLKTIILNPNLGSLPVIDDSTVMELLECLPPMIEILSIRIEMIQYFDKGRVPSKLPASLVHLKYLCIRDSCCFYEYRIPLYVYLIRSCPNLEKLKMKIIYDPSFGVQGSSVISDEYSDMWLEHLNELEIEVLSRRMFRLSVLRLILAKSPVLKTVKIRVCNKISKDEESVMMKMFSECRRVSQVAEIIFENGVGFERGPFFNSWYVD